MKQLTLIKNKEWIFRLILLLAIAIPTYLSRWILVYEFEPEYWENYYYESQWIVPNSDRGIPDEGVYRYIGYRLVNGENPFNVDYWVPPLGKYLYGLSAKYLGNPYFTSYAFYLLFIWIFALIAKQLSADRTLVWLAVYLMVLNPLLVEQIQKTMLDLPITFFMMLSVYWLFKTGHNRSSTYLVLSGVALGLMAGTKPAFFVPMIALVSLIYLYKSRLLDLWFYFLPNIAAGYALAYFCYWMKHPNPIPWLRLHDKVIEFNRGSGGSHDLLNIFRTSFLGRYHGFWEGAKVYSLSWSLILPAGMLAFGYKLADFKKTIKNNQIFFLVLLGIGYILMSFLIDFWPRYLMPLLPVYILILVDMFKSKRWVIVLMLLATLPSLYQLLLPPPDDLIENFKIQNQAGLYRETYRMLDNNSQTAMTEDVWKQIVLSSEIEDLKFKPVKQSGQWKLNLVEKI